MKIRQPIPAQFQSGGTIAQVTQWFGENKNKLFYGPKGHQGIDYRTKGKYKWVWHYNKRVRVERTEDEKNGFIPIVACHGGKLTTNIYYRSRQLGWGMFITWEEKNGDKWRTLNWHIEKPWRRLGTYWRNVNSIFRPKYVREGAMIAIAGNTGYPRSSTGPHLHFELQKQIDGKWESVDPLPYLKGECKKI